MAVEDAIVTLRQYWDDVMSQLPADQADELRALTTGRLNGPDRDRAMARIADLFVDGLPPRHPVRRALAGGRLLAPSAIDWAAITGRFQVLAQEVTIPDDEATEPPGQGPLSAAEILRAVTESLLAEPALIEAEVRLRGTDPGDPGLIRLDRPDGAGQWPLFQFAPGNGPLPVVRRINALLGAATDPLGVAHWWLSRNGWLDGQPSQLLGTIPDDLLLSAARAVGSEV